MESNLSESVAAVVISKAPYRAQLIRASHQAAAASFQRLRYDHFVRQRGWVTPDPDNPGREVDRYDPYCYHLGVFQGPQLVAYLRVLPWQADPGFMLEHEFQDLISEDVAQNLQKDGAVEISRLVVAPPPGSKRSETIELAELLFKLFYCLGKRLGWTDYYIVLEEAWLRVLNRRFALPFVPLGMPHTYPDGTKTVAAYARCEALEQSILAASPDKYNWYQQGMSK